MTSCNPTKTPPLGPQEDPEGEIPPLDLGESFEDTIPHNNNNQKPNDNKTQHNFSIKEFLQQKIQALELLKSLLLIAPSCKEFAPYFGFHHNNDDDDEDGASTYGDTTKLIDVY